jgi:hypothetical protein
MMQIILTYAILAIAIGFTAYKLLQIIIPKKRSDAGCSSGCDCDAVKLKKEVLEKKGSQK